MFSKLCEEKKCRTPTHPHNLPTSAHGTHTHLTHVQPFTLFSYRLHPHVHTHPNLTYILSLPAISYHSIPLSTHTVYTLHLTTHSSPLLTFVHHKLYTHIPPRLILILPRCTLTHTPCTHVRPQPHFTHSLTHTVPLSISLSFSPPSSTTAIHNIKALVTPGR